MYCPKCGKKLGDDAQFCYACGARVVIPEPEDNSIPVGTLQPQVHKKLRDTKVFRWIIIIIIVAIIVAALNLIKFPPEVELTEQEQAILSAIEGRDVDK